MSTLTKKVIDILKRYPEARDSDQELYKYVMLHYYQEFVISDGNKIYVEICDGLPQQQNVARVRREIQEKKELQASPIVRIQRMLKARMYNLELKKINDELGKQIKKRKKA